MGLQVTLGSRRGIVVVVAGMLEGERGMMGI